MLYCSVSIWAPTGLYAGYMEEGSRLETMKDPNLCGEPREVICEFILQSEEFVQCRRILGREM